MLLCVAFSGRFMGARTGNRLFMMPFCSDLMMIFGWNLQQIDKCGNCGYN